VKRVGPEGAVLLRMRGDGKEEANQTSTLHSAAMMPHENLIS
jgi:hypothetical protein